jgi:arylsulfatase A-like enzyme
MKKTIFLLSILAMTLNLHAQRNVILIIADDLSPDYFGFYENHVDTVDVPTIRSLLAKGVRFKNLTSNPVCSSTRTTILTGRYSFRTGVGGIVGGAGGSNQIDTAEISIPRLLNIHDTTIAKADIGKWHLKQPMPAINLMSPLIMGYDHFEGPFIGQLPSYTNWTKYTDGVASTMTNYATTENVNNAVTWLKSVNSTKPFFLWLAFNAPHEPLHLPLASLHSYTSLSGTAANINAQPKEYFKAMIQAMDHEIGRLFDSLQVMNKYDSTDVIFIGDNGNSPRTAQIADTSKAKGRVYEYGVHVPLIISGPSVVNPGRTSDALINTADIFATILDLFGYSTWASQIPVAKPVDSKSMLPIIKAQGNQIRPWAFCEIFKLTHDSDEAKAMRTIDYKLIKFDYGKEEFYNLSLDPLENNDLLLTQMSAADISNYYYLCNEMTNLVGSGSFCNASVGLSTVENPTKIQAYPNPFSTRIVVPASRSNEQLELSNGLGEIIYNGNSISTQDFSNLTQGIYFLKSISHPDYVLKLIKE